MTSHGFRNLGIPPARQQLPFPPYDDHIIKTVERAICAAWCNLKNTSVLGLTTANEKEITAQLQECIIAVLNDGTVEGFTTEIFAQPTRDASVCDFSGNFLEKKPDLTFIIQTARPLAATRGIFFECKPIGNVETYFGHDGLGRFCDGRYAWAMQHAGMIAYVQRKKPPLTANAAIVAKINDKTLTVVYSEQDSNATYHPVMVTKHQRSFLLPSGNVVGPILIRHIWLSTR